MIFSAPPSLSVSCKPRRSGPSPAMDSAAPISESSQDLPSSPWKLVGQGNSNAPVMNVERIGNVAKVSIPDEVLNQSQPLWTNYVVGHFVEEDAPHIGKVHATVNRIWSTPIKSFKIDAQFLNPKTVLFRIDDSVMRSRVLRRHFWHIGDIPMIVQQWCPKTTNLKPDLTSIPIWVDFKDVPDHLFTESGLKFFGNIVGTYQKLHPNTQRCIRLDVARVLVVVNLEEPLPTIISLNTEEETLIQVSYPWLPPRCNNCNSWGHKETECAQMKMGSVVPQSQTKSSSSASSKEALQTVEKEVSEADSVAQVESKQTGRESKMEDTNCESVVKTKGSDTEV